MPTESRTDPKNFKPGLYQHYKGGTYMATMLVEHHETHVLYVVYTSMGSGKKYAREWASVGASSWTDFVKVPTDRVGGITYEEVPRFKLLA
jgi:hypothetical protein